jgi:oligoribonuclease NrnB/cAMP/cGMP phosphodiesterase (DHH superfamily)
MIPFMHVIIAHADCPDGFGAAYAAWKKFGDNARYLFLHPGDPLPDLKNEDVLIFDVSWPRATLEQLAREARSLVLLDHHKTAAADLAGLPFARFDQTHSGAILAWEYLHDTPPPVLLRYIEDRDLWNWALPNAREALAALDSYPKSFAVWDQLEISQLIEEGRVIVRYIDVNLDRLQVRAQVREFAGYRVPVLNSSMWASELGNRLAQGYPFAVIWYDDAEGTRVYSLRSTDAGLDVSEIARRFGGGGHRNAAGFRIPAGRPRP